MAKKLYMDLAIEQMRTLHEKATRLAQELTDDDERKRWDAIARESGRALRAEARKKGVPAP